MSVLSSLDKTLLIRVLPLSEGVGMDEIVPFLLSSDNTAVRAAMIAINTEGEIKFQGRNE